MKYVGFVLPVLLLMSMMSSPVQAQSEQSSMSSIDRLFFCHNYFKNKNNVRKRMNRDSECVTFLAGEGANTLDEYIAINCIPIAELLENEATSKSDRTRLIKMSNRFQCLAFLNFQMALLQR